MKTSRLDTRITPEQRALYERAAALGNFSSLTDFLTAAADKQAEEIIQQHKELVLNEKERELFIDLLLNPPAPNDALRQAASAYKSRL